MVNKYLKFVLIENEKVSIPSMGTFVSTQTSAKIKDNQIFPPTKIFAFEEFSGFHSDTILQDIISKNENITTEEALQKIEEFSTEIKRQIDVFEKSDLEDLGYFKYNEEGQIIFITDTKYSLLTTSLMLQPIDLQDMEYIATSDELKNDAIFKMGAIIIPLILSLLTMAVLFFNPTLKRKTMSWLTGQNQDTLVEDSRSQEFHIDTKPDQNDTSEYRDNHSNILSNTAKEIEDQTESINLIKESTSGGSYFVIVSSCKSKKEAENLVKELVSLGHSDATYFFTEKVDRYRVAIGTYHTKHAADVKVIQVRTTYQEYQDAWLLFY